MLNTPSTTSATGRTQPQDIQNDPREASTPSSSLAGSHTHMLTTRDGEDPSGEIETGYVQGDTTKLPQPGQQDTLPTVPFTSHTDAGQLISSTCAHSQTPSLSSTDSAKNRGSRPLSSSQSRTTSTPSTSHTPPSFPGRRPSSRSMSRRLQVTGKHCALSAGSCQGHGVTSYICLQYIDF